MYIQNVKIISFSKQLARADLARMAGVSRAAVTRWFREGERKAWVNVETRTVIALAAAVDVSPAFFLTPRADLSTWQTLFLWDALYPSMEAFVQALIEKRRPALARLVQVIGFHEATHVAGKIILADFNQYKRYIKPARRKQLETLWPLYAQP